MSHRLTTPVEFRTSDPVTLPHEFYQRLCDFYKRQPAAITSDIWTSCLTYNADLVAALKDGPEALETELMQLYDGGRVTGLDWSTAMYQPHGEWLPTAQVEWERAAFALAASLGVMRVHNPEQSALEVWDAETLIAACEGSLGIQLHHPGGGKMPGAIVGDRLIPYKMLCHAVTLASIRRLRWTGDVLEIGAGCGLLAFLMRQAYPAVGLETVDLPLVTVLQAFLLECASLSPRLQGEGFQRNGLHLNGLSLERTASVGLVINQDSLPEIPPDVALSYLQHVTARTDRGALFLSVNHESSHGAQMPVSVLMRDFPKWRLVQRSPYWGRAGWLEEIWERR